MSIGAPELFFVLGTLLFSVVPLVAAAWALYILHSLRKGQQAIEYRLEALEQLIRRAQG